MRSVVALVVVHLAALGLGILGLTVAVPHPELWAGNPTAVAFNAWALANTGAIDMITGALAMAAYGAVRIGVRRTASFAAVAVVLSAAAELTGTATGWPFGGYRYTGFLGARLLDRVPFTVPLSWFYMGFASYLLARAILIRKRSPRRELAAIALGAALLTAWDLVLDPAMASPALASMHFWIWQEHGAYFGMPLRNLAGWYGTGFAFIGLGRLTWGLRTEEPSTAPKIAFAVYVINVAWAMALALGAGLWPTLIPALVLGVAPAALALRRSSSPMLRGASAAV